jgi:hypothetical protein
VLESTQDLKLGKVQWIFLNRGLYETIYLW